MTNTSNQSRKMRILYLSQYFHPEVGATQTRAYEMAHGLVSAGHHVTLVAEFPNHPSGIMPEQYRNKLYERDHLDGIEVIRVWVKASPVKNTRTRLMFYLSYLLTATLAGALLARKRYDVIYVTSPPLFVGAAGLALGLIRRTPLVFEVRDLWPESAVALGELTNPRVIRLAEQLEQACYRRARHIVLTTQEMKDHLADRGIPTHKMTVIRNGANTDLFRFDPLARTRLRQELELDDKFVLVYAGLLGIAQGLPSVLEAARLVEDDDPAVHWLIIGDGPLKNELVAHATQLGLSSVTFLPAQPRTEIPGFLSAADAALIPLVRQRLIGALPSKMFDAMACERPIVLSAEGESLSVLRQARAGIGVPAESPHALARAVLELKQDPEMAREYGSRGRAAVVANYSRQAQAKQLEELLRTLASSFGPQADVV